MNLHTQEAILCVDYGLDRLTVLEVRDGGISGWSIRDLPPRLIRNGDPVEPAQLAQLLKQTLRESGLTGTRARVTLADEAAIFRLVELPAMPRRHLQRALRYMVDKEIPLPLDRVCWDWDILAKTDIGYRICVVAAWRDVIDRIARVSSEAGLQLEAIEPRSLAIARAFNRDRVVLFDSSAVRLQALRLGRGEIPFVDQAPVGRDVEACARALERLLRRGRTVEEEAENETVVLGGDLEDLELPLSMPAVPVSKILNVQALPAGLPIGSLLANLGLAEPVLQGYRTIRPGVADLNLLGHGSRKQWLRKLNRAQSDWGWRASSSPRRVGYALQAGWLGRIRPRLAGSEVQSD